ncbi:hypothetical protein TNIN_494641 [Trichonephila inaurata madagascariensis]|uniref:Uncharacterized protein n=1 Tax=Trichonephila inaurata madagascariensis TaxID=2747483 RepID=A0A8X6XPC3_9ARAC|nr:hypothetical protein TNIN_494641 [Trichonephila inaurata madagascariensis]
MDEERKFETCQFSLGPIGGIRNPVKTHKPDKLDTGKKIPDEATPVSFIDNLSEEEVADSMKRMNEQWEKMFSEEDKMRLTPIERKRQTLHHTAGQGSDSPKIAKVTQPLIDAETAAAVASGIDASPENVLVTRSKTFFKVLQEEFQTLKAKLTRISHPPPEVHVEGLKNLRYKIWKRLKN